VTTIAAPRTPHRLPIDCPGLEAAAHNKVPPPVQVRFVPAMALDPDAIQSYIKFAELAKEGGSWPAGITMQLLACRPKSRGSVTLASTNPFDLPSVDLGYFTDPEGADLATLKAGINMARHISEQPALAQYLEGELWPGVQGGECCGGGLGVTAVRALGTTGWHWAAPAASRAVRLHPQQTCIHGHCAPGTWGRQ